MMPGQVPGKVIAVRLTDQLNNQLMGVRLCRGAHIRWVLWTPLR